MHSLSHLLKLHKELDALFAEHQFALVRFEFALAQNLLLQYESRLLDHMSDEEVFLLPLYAERAPIEKGGDVKLFLSEHEKMRQHVRLFAESTELLKTDNRPERVLIELLDRESFYKRLCSHHDIREERILYPALDKVTTESERAALFARFAARSAV